MRTGSTAGVRFVAEVVGDGSLAARPLLQVPGHQSLVPLVAEHEAPVPANGDIVVVERHGQAPGRIVGTQPLARSGSVRAELYRIVTRFGIDPLYPPEVHREARRFLEQPGIDDPELRDLTELPFVTIDNDDSRDLDQALYLQRTTDGQGYLVWYALADASYYVQPGSALHEEALRRGASFYLPGLTLPMLPRLLSEDLISLNQGKERRSLVFRMLLDQQGRCVRSETELFRARIRSVRKLSYRQVQRYYDDPAGSSLTGERLRESLDLLRSLGRLRIAEARRRHVVHYHRAELAVHLADDRQLGFTVMTDTRLQVERYNEQISLLCNIEGARLLAAATAADAEQVQAIFRVHPAPARAALDSLAELISSLIELHDLDPQVWHWTPRGDGSLPLADYLERLPRRGHPGRLRLAIERQARMLNERSTFEDAPGRHHGIGAPVYARFSAPMREIVGIFTHKEALEMLAGPAAAPPAANDVELRNRVLRAGNRAKEIQRQLTKQANRYVLDLLLHSELAAPAGQRPRRRGTIMGLTASRLYVQLDDPSVDIKVYVADLEQQHGCRWRLERDAALVPESRPGRPLRIGDPVTVWVNGFSEQRNRWQFHAER